jgi:GMP synthase-like glutamine amidotransferase
MKIGILEIGGPPEALKPDFPGYGEMAAALIGDGHSYQVFEVVRGDAPVRPTDFDAYVITDSDLAVTVADGLWWIPAISNFIAAAKHDAMIVGLGFGHVLMAEAFHGRTALAPDGWTLGMQTYEVGDQRMFLDDCSHICAPAFHRSRVSTAPPGGRVLLSSKADPIAGLWYEGHAALSFHCAPEMPIDYCRAMLAAAWDDLLDPASTDCAASGLDRPNHGPRLGDWIKRFLADSRAGASGGFL